MICIFTRKDLKKKLRATPLRLVTTCHLKNHWFHIATSAEVVIFLNSNSMIDLGNIKVLKNRNGVIPEIKKIEFSNEGVSNA